MNVPYAQPLPREGEILAGKYRVERLLGSGGMGLVVAAMHIHLRERVALKFLHAAYSSRPETVARFLREAQTAVRIKSEHVARIADVGQLENGAPYIVMEFLTGTDLGQLLASRGYFSVSDATEYVLQACEAVAEAHSIGMIHRDLKPANLFLTTRPDGSPLVKVLDFGISKAVDPQTSLEQQQLTSTTAVMGSPLYMSPEQVRSSKTIDARADVWALGVVLYELLSNKHPFEADTMTALLASIIADAPVPLRQRRAEVPPAIEQLVMACLEKDASRRIPSVAHFARALAPFAPSRAQISVERVSSLLGNTAGAARLSLPGPIAAAPSAQPESRTGSKSWGNTVGHRSRSVAIGIGAAVALFCGGAAAIAIALSGGSTPSAGAASASTPAASALAPAASTTAQAAVVVEPSATIHAPPSATASAPLPSATASEASSAPAPSPSHVVSNATPSATWKAATKAPLAATARTAATATPTAKGRDVLDTR